MQKSYQRFAKNVVIVAITNFVQFIVGIVQLPLLTKTLGAHGYGIWMQVVVTRSLIAPFTGLGLGDSMVRFLSAEKNQEEIQEQFYSVILVAFVVNLIASLIIIAFAYPLAMNFFDGAVQVVRITGILVLITPISLLHLELFRTFQQMQKYSLFIIAENCIRIGIFAYLVLSGHDVISIVLAALAIQVVSFLVLFFMVKSQIGIGKPHLRRIKEYFSFGLPLVPRSLSYWLINLSDRYIISFFLGVTPVGIYSAGYGIGGIPYNISLVLTLVLMAPLSQLYDEGRMDEAKTHLSYSLKYFLALTIPFIFGTAILAEPVLRIFSTAEIASEARHVAPVLALAITFLGVHNIVSFVLILTKKTKLLAFIWIVAAALNLGLNILFVPWIGILGAAISTLIAYTLVLCIVSYYSFRDFSFNIDWFFILKSLIASGIMSAVVWFMAPQGTLSTVLVVLAGVVIYGITIILLKGFTKGEIAFFLGLLRRGTSTTNPADDRDK